MKKSLVAIVVIVVVILLIIPNIVGGGIQSATVQTLLAMVPDEANRVLNIRQTEFQRGWFGSYAQIEFTVDELEELTGAPVSLTMDMDISHGPLLFTPKGIRLGLAHADIDPSFMGFSAEELEPETEIETDAPQVNMFAGFDNTVELDFTLDNFQIRNTEALLEVNGLRGTSQILADQSGEGTLELDALTFAIENGSFDLSIQNLLLNGSESDITQPISTGQSSFTIERVNSSAPLPLTVNALTADYQLQQESAAPDYLNLTQQFGIDELDWDMPISSLRWQFQLSHLSRELLNSYLLLIQESQQATGANPAQATTQLTALGQDLVLGLIRENFAFDNTFEVNAFDGDHNLQLNIDWPGLPDLADFQSLDPQAMLQTVQIRLSLDADQAALMASPFAQTVVDYERPGFLIIDNGRVLSTIQLTDGVLDINGELTPLEQFINL